MKPISLLGVILGLVITVPTCAQEVPTTTGELNAVMCSAVTGAKVQSSNGNQWSIAGYYAFKQKEWSLVAATPLMPPLNNIFGIKGFSLDVDGFAGATLNGGNPTVGGALDKKWAVADRATASLGLGWQAHSGLQIPDGFGVFASLVVRF